MAKKTMMCRTCKKPKKGCGCKRTSGVRAPYRCKICHQLKKSCVCKKAAWRVGDDVRQKARACRTCGKMGHDTRNCPEKPCEKTRTCKACGKMGHDTRNCPTIPRRNKQDDKILQRQLNIHPVFQDLPESSSESSQLRGQFVHARMDERKRASRAQSRTLLSSAPVRFLSIQAETPAATRWFVWTAPQNDNGA
eukprot:COSAG01_NODE_1617_length_9718_cov_267.124545_7_plen_193_part_00